MAKTEASRWKSFLVRSADGATVRGAGGVCVGRQGREEWVEDVGREGDQRGR